jgi:uncharacterized protein YaaN involved in tellurite resistance
MFGKSASSITDYLIHSDSFDPDTCKSFLQKSLKKKGDQIIESIEGYQMTGSQKERMGIIRGHLDFVNQMIEKLDTKLDELVAPYELLYSAPIPESTGILLSPSYPRLALT